MHTVELTFAITTLLFTGAYLLAHLVSRINISEAEDELQCELQLSP